MGRAAHHVTRRRDGRAETVNKLLTGSSCQRPRQRPSTVNFGAPLPPADDEALARWLDDLEARVGRQRPHKRVAPRRRWRRRGQCDRDRAVVSVRSCGILSLPLRVAQPSSGPALTQRPPKWHVFYNKFMLTLNQRMCNVFKGRHGLRVKAKLEAAFG